MGSNKISKYLNNAKHKLKKGDQVDIIIWSKTDLGTKVIVNGKHHGLIYSNEVFEEIKMGDRTKGYVKLIRPDNKMDISLQQQGYSNVKSNTAGILDKLRDNNGFLPLNDKSDPDLIAQTLGMSKKTFKKTIGSLYKDRKIKIEKDGIRLLDT